MEGTRVVPLAGATIASVDIRTIRYATAAPIAQREDIRAKQLPVTRVQRAVTIPTPLVAVAM